MTWPQTPPLDTGNIDQDTDSLTAGRAELKLAVDRINAILLEVDQGATIWHSGNDTNLARKDQANTFAQTAAFSKAVTFATTAVFGDYTSTTLAVDWTQSNKCLNTTTANGTLAFTAPPGNANLALVLTDADGIVLPANVQWPGSAHPTLTGTAIVSLLYIGSTYYAVEAVNFGVP